MKLNKNKFKIFLEVARALNKEEVVPILFGSLGLYRIIGEFDQAKDIDVLVPTEVISEKWYDLIKIMEGLGFKLKDEKEHEFIKGSEIVAFAKESDLDELAKIKRDNLTISKLDGIKFKEISVDNYLLVYQLMLRDNYRQEKLGKADQEKIVLIKKYLEKP